MNANTIEYDLASLGEEWQIPRRLLQLRITGQRAQPDKCPIYRFLRRRGHRNIQGVYGDYIQTLEGTRCPIPLGVRVFLRQFDAGYIPQLTEVSV